MNKRVNEHLSSFFVQPLAWIALFLISFALSYGGYRRISIFLFVMACLFLIAFIWGRLALRKLQVDSDGNPQICYPGEQVRVHFQIENKKWIPLLWLQFIQKEPLRDCVEFPEEMEDRTRRFGGLLWYKKLAFEVEYLAKRRGIYRMEEVILRSGDGFGLAQTEADFRLKHATSIIVYPNLLPVCIDGMLKNLWVGSGGRKGYVEDPTLMQGSRPYAVTDSWKKIDWRRLAKGGELETKLFDHVKPQGVLLVLDVREQHSEDLERTISLMASLIVELSEEKVACGLCLPATNHCEPYTQLPLAGETDCAELLLAELAAFEEEGMRNEYDTEAFCLGLPSTVLVYVFTEEKGMAKCADLLEHMNNNRVSLISKEEERGYLLG